MFSMRPCRHLIISAAAAAFLVAPAAAEMRLTSPDVAANGELAEAQILAGMGCDGGNAAPTLAWTGSPEGTKSFVVTMYDPDAPTGSGFWHWSLFDVPGDVTGLDPAGLPQGAIAARNDFSLNAYSGACPPVGQTHRYVISVYAMPQATLPIDASASGALVGFFAQTGALDHASLTARYGR